MKGKKLLKTFGVSMIALSIVATPMTSAAAGETGGGGDGEGGGNNTGDRQWVSIAYDTEGKAYEQFLKDAQGGGVFGSKSAVEQRVKDVGVSISICETSQAVWYLQTGGKSDSYWSWNFNGVNYGPNKSSKVNGSIEKPDVKRGRVAHDSENDAIIDWAKKEKPYILERGPKPSGPEGGYTLLCSGKVMDNPPPKERLKKDETIENAAPLKSSYTKPYSWTTEVKPQLVKNSNGASVKTGNGKLHNQSSNAVKSEFGKLYDSLNIKSGEGKTVAQLKTSVDAALKTDTTSKKSSITLDAANKDGMTAGGILNFFEQTKNATISTTENRSTVVTETCKERQTWDYAKQKWNAWKEIPGTCSTKRGPTTVTSTSAKIDGSLETTEFYQMLSAQCNDPGLNSVLSSGNGVTKNGNTLTSKTYGSQPATLDFGDSNNGNAAKKKTGYLSFFNLLCPAPESEERPTTVIENIPFGETFTEPYSWTTEVKPQLVKGEDGKVAAIGSGKLHNQGGAAVKTEFGKLYDSLNIDNNKGKTAAQLKAEVEAAIKLDKAKARATLTLDADNKAGMAEGGILNVLEQTLPATVSTEENRATPITTTCTHTRTWNWASQIWGSWIKGNCKAPVRGTTTVTATSAKSQGTLANTGFWQMLSVHCNLAEFEALLASDSSITKSSGGDKISGVVNSKKYDQQPAVLDFGDPTNPNAAKKKTGYLSFFDKECPFDCVPTKSGTNDANANGTQKNIGGTGVVAGAKYGAVTDAGNEKLNTNSVELFRDNEPKIISPDVWTPKSGVNGVTYDGSKALSTTVTRDPNGTPGVSGADGGKFTMKALNAPDDKNPKALFTGNGSPTTQKNWSQDAFSTSNSTLLAGLYRDFTMQSSWASEAGAPQILNFKWEYAPNVSTTIDATNIGFGIAGVKNLGTKVNVSAEIEGKCYSYFGVNNSTGDANLIQANTGTGTVNNLDKNLVSSGIDKDTSFVAKFVRSASE